MTDEEIRKSLLRSVDCLQRLYALLLVLATNEMFKRLAERPAPDMDPIFHWDKLPDAITFVVTVVPLYHGMHRHLDTTYAEPVEATKRKTLRRYFLVDFMLTWSAFSFVFAMQMNLGRPAFGLLYSAVMTVTVIWGLVSNIHPRKSFVKSWFLLNAAAMAFAVIFVFA